MKILIICGIICFILGIIFHSSWKKHSIKNESFQVILAGAVIILVLIFIVRPVFIKDNYMAPTYSKKDFVFIFRPYFIIAKPERGQVVSLSYSNKYSYLVKRIIAFPGEKVEFRKGVLYINGEAIEEPYVKSECTWDLNPQEVPKGKFFVLGDNRSMSPQKHVGGMVDQKNLSGVPIW